METKIDYQFLEALFLRVPYYSAGAYALEDLPRILNDAAFRRAIWLASPGFYGELAKQNFSSLRLDKKARHSLIKYYNRMCFRPTPFGAFASFSLTGWCSEKGISLGPAPGSILHLLPSREWQRALESQLAKSGEYYLVRTNPTLNRIGERLRYARYSWDEQGRIGFQINALPAERINLALTRLAKVKPIKRSELLESLLKIADCSEAEGREYLDFLIREQVLLTDLEASLNFRLGWKGIPGDNDGNELLKAARLYFDNVALLADVSDKDLAGLADRLHELMPLPDLKRTDQSFYSALEQPVTSGGADHKIKGDILRAVGVLRKIVIPFTTPNLHNFKEAFRRKFEAQRVPFLVALDPDTGINYGGMHTSLNGGALLDGLSFPQAPLEQSEQEWTAVHRMFLRIWLQNSRRGAHEPVLIRDLDTKELNDGFSGFQLPPSLPVMFRMAGDKLHIESAGGATGTSLIGRFSVFSEQVAAQSRELARAESAANPEVIFAEIHQLSDLHTDNINRRMPVYDYVIHLATYPAETGQTVIAPSDLMLSMRGEELILESISLGKRIVPRLPTAFNFHHNDLALFQMLCDLQFQGLQANLNFDPEKLFPGMDFYPRFEYENTVLSLAKWHIGDEEKAALLTTPLSLGRLHLFCQRRGIPPQISMGLSDQQLVFNLQDDQEALFFLDCLREQQRTTLREYLPPDSFVSSGGKVFAGQLIALAVNHQAVYQGAQASVKMQPYKTQRHYLPGSTWMYVKIYCTLESADRLLKGAIYPVLKANKGLVDCWFFVRYQDPEPHIRLRVRSGQRGAAHLLGALQRKLAQVRHCAFVRGLQTDTYQREIERYSPELMEACELCFQAGSDWVMAELSSRRGQKAAVNLDPFCLVYRMAEVFLGDAGGVAVFFSWRAASFFAEFGGKKQLRVGMDIKYRKLSSALDTLLANNKSDEEPDNLSSRELKRLLAILSEIAGNSKLWHNEKRYNLLSDLIHMQVNRMYSGMQRQHEALICYSLQKYAASCNARGRTVLHSE